MYSRLQPIYGYIKRYTIISAGVFRTDMASKVVTATIYGEHYDLKHEMISHTIFICWLLLLHLLSLIPLFLLFCAPSGFTHIVTPGCHTEVLCHSSS